MTTIDIAPPKDHRRLIQKKPIQISSFVTKGAIKSTAKLRLNLSQEQIQTHGEKIEILPPSELNQYQQTQEMIEAKESKNSISQEQDDEEDEDHSDDNDDDYNSEESASEISQNISDLMASPAKEITSDQKDLAEEIEKEPDSIFGSAVAEEQEEEEKKENIDVPIEEIDSFFAKLRQKKLKSTEKSAMSVVQQILAKREAQKLKDEWKAINTRLQCLKTRNCILQTDNKTKAAE